ncbi:MAG TPA: hypothetical protein DIT58_15385 [Porticoccaceae bacterium]|nr:hypothetical protein [Porticoccaceae bacterium]
MVSVTESVNRMKLNTGIKTRIALVFLFQGVLISLAAVGSLVAASYVIEKVLVEEALALEAEYFIDNIQHDPQYPLPLTKNLTGYRASAGNVPPELTGLEPGFYRSIEIHSINSNRPVYVSRFDDDTLYLLYGEQSIDALVYYFGLLPLASVLVVLYLMAGLGYIFARRAVSPVVALARQVKSLTPGEARPLKLPQSNDEVGTLAAALEQYAQRVTDTLERERQFTSDVSHELRTPLTVLNGAVQVLLGTPELTEFQRDKLQMMQRSIRDMNELIPVLLLIAREHDPTSARSETCNLADVVAQEIENHRSLLAEKPVEVRFLRHADRELNTVPQALAIVIGNLIRNAFLYTEAGEVVVTLQSNRLLVEDTGTGIHKADLPHLFKRHIRGRGQSQPGQGIGLALVKQLCDRFGWRITVQNSASGGVIASLTF